MPQGREARTSSDGDGILAGQDRRDGGGVRKANPEFEVFDDSADDGFGGTSPVGSYPSGASKWGFLDMAGNVFQWTGGDYDGRENRENCLPRAACKEIRGSGWITNPLNLRASFREGMDPANWFASLGFRCALN
jgi:formylglycine-generating enzyme required for sulfatase activity